MDENAAIWAILCVLVVLVLILAAVLIAGGRRKNEFTPAVAIGGGIAMAWGRDAPPFYGGRPRDLSPDDIRAGDGNLGFPADQPTQQVEHHKLRAKIAEGLTAYFAASGRPTVVADPDVAAARKSFSLMCDAMRGGFGGRPARPSGPWHNPAWPGPGAAWPGPDASRGGVWRQARDSLEAALGRLAPRAPLDAQVHFDAALVMAKGLNAPNVSDPASLALAALTAVDAGTHPKSPRGIPLLRGLLTKTLTTYGNADPAVGPVLRRGSFISVADADRHAADAVAAFNRLAAFYAAGPTKFADVAGSIAERRALWGSLVAWARALSEGDAPAVPLAAKYKALVDEIGGPDPRVGDLSNSLREMVATLRWPPAPKWPARVFGSVARDARGIRQPRNISAGAVGLNTQLDGLLTAYNACSAAYELDWDTIGPLERDVEQAFAALLATYNLQASIDTARQSVTDKANIITAVVALGEALKVDAAFLKALRSGPPANARAVALKAAADNLGGAVAALLPGATAYRLQDLPAEPASVLELIDPRSYGQTLVDVGYRCRDLLAAVFRNSAAAAAPRWGGVRTQVQALRREYSVDPAAPGLAAVERDAEQMAASCQRFANTGDPAAAAAAANARIALTRSLAALDAEIQAEPLLADGVAARNAARKAGFAAGIARAQAALAAIPPLVAPSSGVARTGPPVSPPLPDSARLIHYEHPPTETIGIARDVTEIVPTPGADVVIEAKTTAGLEAMIARLPDAGPRVVYGLVVDRPGDMVALYKAVAICLKMRPPPSVESKVADRKNAATGWLYDILRFESGAHYSRLREYIKPELYAV